MLVVSLNLIVKSHCEMLLEKKKMFPCFMMTSLIIFLQPPATNPSTMIFRIDSCSNSMELQDNPKFCRLFPSKNQIPIVVPLYKLYYLILYPYIQDKYHWNITFFNLDPRISRDVFHVFQMVVLHLSLKVHIVPPFPKMFSSSPLWKISTHRPMNTG